MSAVWLESHVKYGGRFVPIAEANAPVPDSIYIEGALYISVDSREFFTLTQSDFIE